MRPRITLTLLLAGLLIGSAACALIAVHSTMVDAADRFEAAQDLAERGDLPAAAARLGEARQLFGSAAVTLYCDAADYRQFHERLMDRLEALHQALSAGHGERSVQLFAETTSVCEACHAVYN